MATKPPGTALQVQADAGVLSEPARWTSPDEALSLRLPEGVEITFFQATFSGTFRYELRPGERSRSVLKGSPVPASGADIGRLAPATRRLLQQEFPGVTTGALEYFRTAGGLEGAAFGFSGIVPALGGPVQAQVLVLPLAGRSVSVLTYGPSSTALDRRFREFRTMIESARGAGVRGAHSRRRGKAPKRPVARTTVHTTRPVFPELRPRPTR